MSHRGNKLGKTEPGTSAGNRNDTMNMLTGINHIIMCRSCQYKPLCKHAVLCQMEGNFNLKFEMISEKIGVENFRKLTIPEINVEVEKITDAEVQDFGRKKMVEVMMKKPSVETSAETPTVEQETPQETPKEVELDVKP
jgi:hypothetical protein